MQTQDERNDANDSARGGLSREGAIRKIRACLRLAASSNPNEAAAALRQARKLMALYCLDAWDVEGVKSESAPTRSRGAMCPASIVALASIVANGYACRVVVECLYDQMGPRKTHMRFYGGGAGPTVAAYAFTTLRRQLETDRAKHGRTMRTRKTSVRAHRLEMFSLGWVRAIEELFPAQQQSDSLKQAISLAVESGGGMRGTTRGRDVLSRSAVSDLNDQARGYLSGLEAGVSPALERSSANSAVTEIGVDP